jgi:hypothetical protein
MEKFDHLLYGLQNLAGVTPIRRDRRGRRRNPRRRDAGHSPSMAVALLLPFTFGDCPASQWASVMLCAIYLAATNRRLDHGRS